MGNQGLRFVLASVFVGLCAPAQITLSLVANDDIEARWINLPSGTLGGLDTHPAGPLSNAIVQVSGGSQQSQFDCDLSSYVGFDELTATTICRGSYWPSNASTHADLTLTIDGPVGRHVGISIDINHFGDYSSAEGFRIDVEDDGTIDLDSVAPVGSTGLHEHLHLSWDFAGGPLPIRIRTDQLGFGGPQMYSLRIRVWPWTPAATPAGPDCGLRAALYDGHHYESSNYHMTARASSAPGELAILQATGLGQLNAFVVAAQPMVMPLQLPPPFTTACDILANGLSYGSGTVTELNNVTPVLGYFPPREWQLVVPTLPPGLTFYVQHASASSFAPFWFGTTNRIRFDT
ncbi:MAG: hypothetical protein ACJAQZ_000118 [Planctomycetota bacterium]|jgi:hypothetical protein